MNQSEIVLVLIARQAEPQRKRAAVDGVQPAHDQGGNFFGRLLFVAEKIRVVDSDLGPVKIGYVAVVCLELRTHELERSAGAERVQQR